MSYDIIVLNSKYNTLFMPVKKYNNLKRNLPFVIFLDKSIISVRINEGGS
jgi:hypothetical protein